MLFFNLNLQKSTVRDHPKLFFRDGFGHSREADHDIADQIPVLGISGIVQSGQFLFGIPGLGRIRSIDREVEPHDLRIATQFCLVLADLFAVITLDKAIEFTELIHGRRHAQKTCQLRKHTVHSDIGLFIFPVKCDREKLCLQEYARFVPISFEMLILVEDRRDHRVAVPEKPQVQAGMDLYSFIVPVLYSRHGRRRRRSDLRDADAAQNRMLHSSDPDLPAVCPEGRESSGKHGEMKG